MFVSGGERRGLLPESVIRRLKLCQAPDFLQFSTLSLLSEAVSDCGIITDGL